MKLCTYSKSAILQAQILDSCPLGLTRPEAKGCICRRRESHVPPADLRVLTCTHPLTWAGDVPVGGADGWPGYVESLRAGRVNLREKPSGKEQDRSEQPNGSEPNGIEAVKEKVMSSSRFKTAVREKERLRMAIDGPSGSGKSLTALRFACALGKKVAVIDTENRSSRLYLGEEWDGHKLAFEVCDLKDSYSPSEYTAVIEEAGRAGFDVLVIDSLSHAWEGKDGALEIKDKSGDKNTYTAWKTVTPMHNKMVGAILSSPCHVIVTMRSKQDYVLEKNDEGKMVPRKVGMAPVQRWGMEYEFTIYGSMDWSHIMTISKSRCSAVADAIVVKPGAAFIEPVLRWLETGINVEVRKPSPRIDDEQVAKIVELIGGLRIPLADFKKDLPKKFAVVEIHELTQEQGKSIETDLAKKLALRQKKDAEQAAAAQTNGTPPAPTATAAAPTAQAQPAAGADQRSLPLGQQRLTDMHVLKITELKTEWDAKGGMSEAWNDAWKAALAKFEVATARNLTIEQAEKFIAAISRALGKGESADANGKSTAGAGADTSEAARHFAQT
jgi:hypothetical protein